MQNQHLEPCENKAGSIIGEKIAGYVRSNSIGKVVFRLFEFAASILFAWVLIDRQSGLAAVISIATAGNFAILKIFTAFFIIKRRSMLFKLLKKVFCMVRRARSRAATGGKEGLICGIPKNELIDYLVRNQHFKREGINGVRATFGLNMDKFNSLAEQLESSGILERGENNSRVLGQQWSRQALVSFFDQQSTGGGFRNWIRIRSFQRNDENKIRLNKGEIAASV